MIADYLEQLSTEEIDAMVAQTVDELGVREDGMRAMGRVMGVLTPKTKGQPTGALWPQPYVASWGLSAQPDDG